MVAGFISEPHSVLSRGEIFHQTLEQLLPSGLRTRCRLLLTGAGVSHGESEPVLIGDWLQAASNSSCRCWRRIVSV